MLTLAVDIVKTLVLWLDKTGWDIITHNGLIGSNSIQIKTLTACTYQFDEKNPPGGSVTGKKIKNKYQKADISTIDVPPEVSKDAGSTKHAIWGLVR